MPVMGARNIPQPEMTLRRGKQDVEKVELSNTWTGIRT
jgi:hypothetical protein